MAITQKIPAGPKGRLPMDFDQTVEFVLDPLNFLMKASQYGDVSYFKLGQINAFLVNNPDYIRDVLVTHNRQFIKGDTIKLLKYTIGEGLLTSEGDF